MRKVTGAEVTPATIGQFLPRGAAAFEEIRGDVQKIIDKVREAGDEALRKLTNIFDLVDLRGAPLEAQPEEYDEAYAVTPPEVVEALRAAATNIRKFHAAQLRDEWTIEVVPGVQAGQITRPLDAVGLYIPGGKAVYPSTVLMTAIPAKVAGVPKVIACSPPQANGKISSAILVAARECGVDAVYKVGGAQAVAAMALGTESVPKVDKIVGPGNKWVNVAKQIVATEVGIDNPAGPSDVLIIADGDTPVQWAVQDFIAQVEHGPDNVAVLVSHDAAFVEAFEQQLAATLPTLGRRTIVEDNLEKSGLIVVTESLEESVRVSNVVGPEHLQLMTRDPRSLLPGVRHAGAVFVGIHSAVPFGDFCAGTNHVLPTGGYAHMYSGLSTHDYLKVMDVLEMSPEGARALCPTLETLADFEGLPGHRDSANCRSESSAVPEGNLRD